MSRKERDRKEAIISDEEFKDERHLWTGFIAYLKTIV